MNFWIIVALMLVVGVAVLVWVLLKKRSEMISNQKEQNVLLAKEKLAELDKEKASGALDEAVYMQAKEELETGLLEDIEEEEVVARVRPASAKAAAVLLAVLVPALSIGLYMQLGSPHLIGVAGGATASNPHQMQGAGAAPSMEELLAQLEQKMRENPEDAEGWFMLGRVYQSMNRFADAAKAYEELRKLTDDHPQALIALADALAMTQGGRMAGRPYDLVRQALDKAPDDTTALWLAGQGATEMGDYQNAIYYFRQAEAGVAEKPEYVQELRLLIQQVKSRAKQAGITVEDPGSAVPEQVAVTASAGIALRVSLSPELKTQVAPDDRLFIFAKQVGGRPMPVAAVRLAAGDLPVEVVLDDSKMLQPGSHLSDYKQLKLMARISKGSQPMASSGDLQSQDVIARPGQEQTVQLLIDQVIP